MPQGAHQADGAEHGAVAADADGEVETDAEDVVGHPPCRQGVDDLGVRCRDPHVVASGLEPRRHLAGELGGEGAAVMDDETDVRATARPDPATSSVSLLTTPCS